MPPTTTKERKSRPFPWPCSNCLTRTVVPTVSDYTAKVKHDGVVYEFHFPELEIPRCQTCGETYTTTAIDERVSDALRSRLGLLTPAQIRRNIEKLGLNQQELAELVGVAPETISRWVNGALIQSMQSNTRLREVFAFPEVRDMRRRLAQDPHLGIEVRLDTEEDKERKPPSGEAVPPAPAVPVPAGPWRCLQETDEDRKRAEKFQLGLKTGQEPLREEQRVPGGG
jgi:transcriptional regulator with XRE-family HTH domain